MKPQNSNQDNQISGLLCIDKPEGCTSFDVVRKVRRALSVRRVGHGGTLDPLATGLLVVLVGKASKLQDIVMGGVKRYQGLIKIGMATDTDDITGETLSTSTENFNLCSTEFRDRIAQIAVKYTGQIDQIPPQYSSIKVQGKRSYALARSGKSVEHRPRQVEIYQLELEAVSESELSYNLVCSKGTYVRSLARDIGEDLGLGACVKSIRR
ncbi:MAG: tRNA pseudouridine(55) synthase TruB, partial [Bdellovibrionales bacterium]|nr:tRNA pseudouridine(55) synthase TruB [Bdellovibrionales bacterium]